MINEYGTFVNNEDSGDMLALKMHELVPFVHVYFNGFRRAL
jgi:hypothetical protein